jgi:predicted house-cleaning noncanonical NTP pyrophosphatase (MazG superfamily)
MIYNKAVRDKIPQIIKNSNSKCNFKTLTDEEFLIEIQKKLSEEVQEYLDNNDVTELADILEVVYRIAHLKGVSKDRLEEIRIQKAVDRG